MICVDALKMHSKNDPRIDHVRICVANEETRLSYQTALDSQLKYSDRPLTS
jgi:hypothetical protein